MNQFARLLAVVGALLIGLGLAGCSPTPGKSWGSSGGSVSRRENGTWINYTLEQLRCDDRVYLVLAANGCRGSGGGGGSGTYRGQLDAKDGRKITWSCSTPDGKSGKVVIDGQEFDLTEGALFLVSTKDKPTRVEQLVIDAGQLQAGLDTEKFSELAKADPRIAKFLETCKDSK
jgi:hypothetical protein